MALGLAWITLLASRAPTGSGHGATGSQVLVMLLLACTAYLPLFFFNVAWFLPLALLPRGVLSELLVRWWPGPRT